jgi:hypothetical protein
VRELLGDGAKDASAIEADAADPAKKPKLRRAAVRLNNNGLSSLGPLYRTLDAILVDVTSLLWIDLSFNAIPSIGDAFKRLPKLRRLYLHANNISLLSDVDALDGCRELECLTLHGNPVREKPNYRMRGACRGAAPTWRRLPRQACVCGVRDCGVASACAPAAITAPPPTHADARVPLSCFVSMCSDFHAAVDTKPRLFVGDEARQGQCAELAKDHQSGCEACWCWWCCRCIGGVKMWMCHNCTRASFTALRTLPPQNDDAIAVLRTGQRDYTVAAVAACCDCDLFWQRERAVADVEALLLPRAR